ncbi:thiamine phosphate synthase [Patescibacteria group bacterium]|nr:thiamine phosphate synthase [Patescibacteria group bacterium]
MNIIDCSLYFLTDKDLAKSKNRTDEEIVRFALKGGATVVQIRDKRKYEYASMDDPVFRSKVKKAERIHRITREYGVPLIINDHVEIARTIDAEGVHVGQEDMYADRVRLIIGPNKILGVSVKTPEEAIKAVADGADYLGVGDIFGTATKKDAGKPTGLEVLKEIAEIAGKAGISTVGIGGINKDNAKSVIENGMNGIAVISAIVLSDDPEAAARSLRSVVDETRRELRIETNAEMLAGIRKERI